MEKLNGFISYAHEDAALCALLLVHLAADETRNHVTFWTDVDILAGKAWKSGIADAIAHAHAHVILMLNSAFFNYSKFIREVELPAIRVRDATGE